LSKLCEEAASDDSSSSSASGQAAPGSCTAQRQQQQQLAALEPLLQPWALVQVQLMQLSGMQRAAPGWLVNSSYVLMSLFELAQRKGDTARIALNHMFLQPVLLQLLPHLQDVCNIWGTADTSTASSSSSSGRLSQAAAGLARRPGDVIQLQKNLSQLLVSLVNEGGVGTSQWYSAGDASCVRLRLASRQFAPQSDDDA
jgi:hypothetical protein